MKASVLLSTLWLALAVSPALAAPPEVSDLGSVDFPTSGSGAAQAQFLRGVAALHSFWYDEAADAFRAARELEPGFAMAYWGEAMTHDHPIWSEQETEAAREVLARLAPTPAARAAKAPTERERAYLAAAEALFGDADEEVRERSYSEAMERLWERHPEDLEAGSFYALSLLGRMRPGETGDARYRLPMRAAAVLEELFAKNPRHPGVAHYLIHAYDDPVHAPLGLRAALVYARIAPAAHHALHMPSHIFVQLGRWADAAASNEAAWAASVAWTERRGLPVAKRDFHSLSWLEYAYLQQGRRAKALEVLEIARAARRASDNPRIASSLEAMEARYAIEAGTAGQSAPAAAISRSPAAAAAAPKTLMAGCDAHGHGGGAALLAAGLAAARSGDEAGAEAAAAGLRELAGKAQGYEAVTPRVMEKEVSGLARLAAGKVDEGLALLAEAADEEAGMGPPSGPPEPIQPAAELYGEALLQQGRAQEAAAAFARALLRTPNRPAALLGAARAAAKLGDGEEARRRYAALLEAWREADPGRPEVAEAQGFLAAAPASPGASGAPAGAPDASPGSRR